MSEGERGGGRPGDRRGPGGEPPARPSWGQSPGGSLRRCPVPAEPLPRSAAAGRGGEAAPGSASPRPPPLAFPAAGPAVPGAGPPPPCSYAGRCPGAAGSLPSLLPSLFPSGGPGGGQPPLDAGRRRAARPAAAPSAVRGRSAVV